jgi:hypothetical protein
LILEPANTNITLIYEATVFFHTATQITPYKHDLEREIKKDPEKPSAIIINRSELSLEEGHSDMMS